MMENDFHLSTTVLRKCSLQFERLTAEQEAKLDYFIRNFTAGCA